MFQKCASVQSAPITLQRFVILTAPRTNGKKNLNIDISSDLDYRKRIYYTNDMKKVTLLCICRLIIKIALVFSFGLLVYKKSTWHYFPDPNTILVKSEVKEIKDYDVVKIYRVTHM